MERKKPNTMTALDQAVAQLGDLQRMAAELEQACRTHDWWYHYCDDPWQYREGRESWYHLNRLRNRLTREGEGDQAAEIFDRYAPEGFRR